MAALLAGVFGYPNTGLGQPVDSISAQPTRPDSAQRVVHVFDFEEPDNPYPVPRFWERTQDAPQHPHPGFPPYNEAAFDFTVAASGKASVHLPARGGSTALRLAPGVLPVFPLGDYTVTASVRTDGLTSSRAFLTARLLNQDQHPIPGASVTSRPLSTGGTWERISVDVAGIFENAAFLQIDLELLQPRQFAAAAEEAGTSKYTVWAEDLGASAWFDDIGIYQLPRVELSTTSPSNIVAQPERPVLRMIVRDLVGEKLDARLVVRDLDGDIVDQATLSVAGPRPIDFSPALSAFGWYHASLDVLLRAERVGHADTFFIYVPSGSAGALGPGATGAAPERVRFGISADTADPAEFSSIPAVVRHAHTGFITLPVWDQHVSRGSLAESLRVRGPILDELLRLQQSVTLAIPSLPAEISRELRVDECDSLALAQVDSKEWFDYLLPVLDRYGQRITRWQVGRVGDDQAFWHPSLPAAVTRVRDLLAALVPGPAVQVPWRADRQLPGSPAASAPAAARSGAPSPDEAPSAPHPGPFSPALVLTIPASFPPGAVSALEAQWRTAGADLTFIPELDRSSDFSRRASVIDLARRTVELWNSAAAAAPGSAPARFAVDRPWEWVGDRRPQLMPLPELAVWRTLVDHLAGRRILGELPIVPGVRCFILAPLSPSAQGHDAPGALVAWNESASPADAVINAYLGAGTITLVDMFGNATPAPRNNDAAGTHSITIGETPLFIEGADPYLARFVASFALEPDFAPTVAAPHEHSVVLFNPWPVAIDGKLQILPPAAPNQPARGAPAGAGSDTVAAAARAGWTITPAGNIPFFIEPGQSKEIPFTLIFPPAEEAGLKPLTVLIRLAADHPYPPLRLTARLELGLKDLDMVPECQLSPGAGGPDVVVTVAITNRGTVPRLLQLDAAAPDTPSRQIPVSELGPGQTVLKRLVFKDAAARLAGKRIRISLSDAEASDRLNKSIRVP